MFFGAIEDDPGNTFGLPVDIHSFADHADAAPFAVAAADGGLKAERFAVFDGVVDRLADHRAVFGLIELDNIGDADGSAWLQSGDIEHLIGPVQPPGGDIDPPAADIDRTFGLTKNLGRFLERYIGKAQRAGTGIECEALLRELG